MFASPQLIQTEVFTEVPQALRKSGINAERMARRPRALLARVATLLKNPKQPPIHADERR